MGVPSTVVASASNNSDDQPVRGQSAEQVEKFSGTMRYSFAVERLEIRRIEGVELADALPLSLRGELCASLAGLSVHAKVALA